MDDALVQQLQERIQDLQNELDSRLKLFDILIDSLVDVVYILDPDGNIIEVSKRVEDYGYKKSELRGKPFSIFVEDQHKKAALDIIVERREQIQEVKQGDRKEYSQVVEMPFIVKPSGTKDMEVSGGAFIADFKVETIRIHMGDPIRKNHIYTVGIARDISDRKRMEREKEQLIAELQQALDDVKTLSGLLPVCAACRKVRDDKGYWKQIESYIESRSDLKFSHSVCPECAEKLYGEEKWFKKIKKKN